jgi:hypothetical protein
MCLIIDSTGIQLWANHFSVHEADFFLRLSTDISIFKFVVLYSLNCTMQSRSSYSISDVLNNVVLNIDSWQLFALKSIYL